ncbi:NAD(P)-dependent dehydrogenase (short-subunit alcohol dehydrogenase family) [Nocardioides ginsengisegetis]|uniref:NAD(P)-dependent dehydrogenase (Short-subunit alcohol dehydrogenase family) n=1 Tax=Nocardioides ginsengisegetis TaxID=661491 RepID=A0A7W3J2D7_9ACTN|nr:NAD(P)-dependent dehydrogenase (short-subunit alcohol dehydrogenase family) [Nocardioides ginsengisegetis]
MARKRPADLDRKLVAITGAARGIGLATARSFLAAGAVVAIADVDGELAERVAAEIGAHAFTVDVADVVSFGTFLDQVETKLGPIDVLVNNAGIMPIGPLPDEPEQVTQRIVSINLLGALHGTKLAMARMLPRGSGHIINVASAVGRFAAPNSATYSATKFGVVGLTQAVRGELRGTGIEASVILPAATNTDLVSGLTEAGKVVEPEDVAAAIVGVVRKPRFETWVPRSDQRSFKLMQLLPYRVFEAAAYRAPATGIFLSQDSLARAAYEDRARG